MSIINQVRWIDFPAVKKSHDRVGKPAKKVMTPYEIRGKNQLSSGPWKTCLKSIAW